MSTLVVAATASFPATAGPGGRTTDAFVQRDGSTLTLQGKPFRFAGTHLYWLGLDENVGGVDHPERPMTAIAELAPVVRACSWGSRTAVPALLGQQPNGEPQAELWFGAHHATPSPLTSRPGTPDPAAAITADPVGELGEASHAAHGPRLPFLPKLPAAARALSVQVHPTREQARAGHDREDAAGIPVDAPHHTFKDRNHKPELLCALGPFEALCGFREPARTADLLDALSAPGLERRAASLRSHPQRDSLGYTLQAALTAPRRLVRAVADALPALAASPGPWSSAAAAYATVADDFPDDPGLLAALLLNHVTPDAGEALYPAAGVPHAYLRGTGVETMASSDNVLRCDLTDKHVGTGLLSEIVGLTATRPSVTRASPTGVRGEAHYASSATEFALSRVEVGAEAVCLTDAGPQVLLCPTGEALLEAGPALAAGAAAFVPAGRPCAVSGAASVLYRARAPLGGVS
ncbi:mannose-6-phosphate isomerase, class I [Streptomyces sp. NEAU-W12]|uniref:mannose-6-phosphate isomerase, class I n=1 Tax=Streptomyces sp. NEAU-W12 TaxID=2994668 RepID=UPI00224B968A|nr:mannose-6-phosphate isomerase, class I [Streptomyces sp. NEAU-W12]MCX2928053.1 mannose-6-phosphate isomerase, class I [Streptomyces sp. NEAU-W12]